MHNVYPSSDLEEKLEIFKDYVSLDRSSWFSALKKNYSYTICLMNFLCPLKSEGKCQEEIDSQKEFT